MIPRCTIPVLVPLLAGALLPAALLAQPGSRQRQAPPQLEHLVFETRAFDSKALGSKSSYGLLRPKSFDPAKDPDKRYPLILWLHGMFEDHARFHSRGETAIVDKLCGEGKLPEFLMVFADGGRNSFFMNGKESGRYEDLIVQDLMAEIEAKLPVAKPRELRAIMGVSMGGGAALRIAIKHPQLFGIAATHSAALFPADPEELPARHKQILYSEGQQGFGLNRIFGVPPDLEMWRRENVFVLLADMKAEQLQGLKLYFDCGDADRYQFHLPGQKLDELLTGKKIAHTWRCVPNGRHGTEFVRDNLDESLGFVAAAFAKAGGLSALAPGGAKAPPTESRPAQGK